MKRWSVQCDRDTLAMPLFEALEPRCLLSGGVGPGDVDPDEIRIGVALVVEANQDSVLTIQRASHKLEITKRDDDGALLWSRIVRTGTGISGAAPLALTEDGGVIIAGIFTGTTDFDPGGGVFTLSSVGKRRAMFVLKLDADGQFVWSQAISGKGHIRPAAVAVHEQQILVAASFSGTLDFDPGAGMQYRTSAGKEDMAVLRLDAQGQWLSAVRIGGRGKDMARDLAVDSNGQIYLVGSFCKSLDADPGAGVFPLVSRGSNDGVVVRFDSAGEFAWAGRIGGRGDDSIGHVVVGPLDDVWFAGSFRKSSDIDPTDDIQQVISAGGRDIFLGKLDRDGALVWAGTLGGRKDDTLSALTAAADGGLLLTGGYRAGFDLDPGAERITFGAAKDGIFVLRLTDRGLPLWAGRIGGGRFETVWDIASDLGGRAWLLGNDLFRGTDFDPGPEKVLLNRPGVFLCKLDDEGQFNSVYRA